MIKDKVRIVAALAAALCFSGGVFAAEMIPGPVPAEVIRVHDGDTFSVRAHIWLGQRVEVSIRVAGVDTPEMRGRCADETAAAHRAKAATAAFLAGGDVMLVNVKYDKYGGRAVAGVIDKQGRSLAEHLIAAGLAAPYAGGTKRSWCG